MVNTKRKTNPGDVFHELTVIEIDHRDTYGALFYRCKCSCGNEVVTRGTSLRKGDAKSCGKGCRKRDTNTDLGEAARNRVLYQYKRDAAKRGLWFLLSDEQFDELATSNCFYCGQEPSNENKSRGNKGNYVYNGIDRLDSQHGYYLSNCVPCCKICNHAKSDLDPMMFFAWVDNISKVRMEMTPETIGRIQTESAQQSAFFCWCASQKFDERLKFAFHIPNGGLRDKITASNLAREGVRKGVPDVFVPIPSTQYAGLWIEFKRPGTETQKAGKLSEEQEKWIAYLQSQKYFCFVAYDYLSAIKCVLEYLRQSASQ